VDDGFIFQKPEGSYAKDYGRKGIFGSWPLDPLATARNRSGSRGLIIALQLLDQVSTVHGSRHPILPIATRLRNYGSDLIPPTVDSHPSDSRSMVPIWFREKARSGLISTIRWDPNGPSPNLPPWPNLGGGAGTPRRRSAGEPTNKHPDAPYSKLAEAKPPRGHGEEVEGKITLVHGGEDPNHDTRRRVSRLGTSVRDRLCFSTPRRPETRTGETQRSRSLFPTSTLSRHRASLWCHPATMAAVRVSFSLYPNSYTNLWSPGTNGWGNGPEFYRPSVEGCLAKKSCDSRRGRWSSVKARTRGWPQQPCPTIQWQGTNLSAQPATRLWGPHGGGSNDAREFEQWGPYASESEGLGERGPPVIHETWWGKAGLRSVRAHSPEAGRASGGMGQNCGIRPTLGLHFFSFSFFSISNFYFQFESFKIQI
jgi:hypothetical protein